jgi:peptidoglycan hydrolase-like protein with peptidoglycan-binding domain
MAPALHAGSAEEAAMTATRHVALSLALALAAAVPALAHDPGHEAHEQLGRARIQQAQERLNDLGYPIGEADGVLGPKTHTAVRNFQRDKGLNATGDLDEKTMAALTEGRDATSGTR